MFSRRACLSLAAESSAQPATPHSNTAYFEQREARQHVDTQPVDGSVRTDEIYSLISRAVLVMTVALPSLTCDGCLGRLTLRLSPGALSCHNADCLIMCSPS
jgi:hypothetical protein